MLIRSSLPAALLAAFAQPGAAAPLEVTITNVLEARGRVHIDVCPENDFLSSECPYSAEAPAVIGATTVMIPHLPPGRYAVQAFQDENENGKADRGPLGIPKEPIGISRDAPIHLKPPRWKDAWFDHGGEPQQITLKLRKFL